MLLNIVSCLYISHGDVLFLSINETWLMSTRLTYLSHSHTHTEGKDVDVKVDDMHDKHYRRKTKQQMRLVFVFENEICVMKGK